MATNRRTTLKECYRCRTERPVADFILKKNGQTCDMCFPCLGAFPGAALKRPKARVHHADTERTCYLCTRVLPIAQFTRRLNVVWLGRGR